MPNQKTIWITAGIALITGAGTLGYLLYDALLPLFLAFALSYAFSPVVSWLDRKGLSRTEAILLIMFSLILIALGAVGVILPVLIRDARQFIVQFPEYAATALNRTSELGDRFGIVIPIDKTELLDRIRGSLQGISLASLRPVAAFAGKFFSGAVGLVVAGLNVVLIPVYFFYVLRDLPQIRDYVFDLVPAGYRKEVQKEFARMDEVFSGYIRGQISVALILACVFSLGLSLMGIKFGLFIGILSGLLNIIPYLGQATGLGLALVMALVDFTGWGRILMVPLFFGVVNYLEGTFLTPRIVGDKVGLSPVQTILALIVGGEIAGFLGLLIAIPTAGCLKALALDLIEAYRRSKMYAS